MPTLSEQLVTTMNTVDGLIQGAQNGATLDIPALERTIGTICFQSQACKGTERSQVRSAMQNLIAKLDILSGILQQQKDALATEVKSTTTGQQAAKAYLKAKKN